MVDFAAAKAKANAKIAKERLGLNIPDPEAVNIPTHLQDSKYLSELELIDAFQDSDDSSITDWERKFVASLKLWVTSFEHPSQKPLTPKQRQVLLKICVRLNIEMERAPLGRIPNPPAPTLAEYTTSRQHGISADDMDDDIPF